MSQKFFLQRGDTKTGPFTSDQIQGFSDNGKLQPTDLVYYEDGRHFLVSELPSLGMGNAKETVPVIGELPEHELVQWDPDGWQWDREQFRIDEAETKEAVAEVEAEEEEEMLADLPTIITSEAIETDWSNPTSTDASSEQSNGCSVTCVEVVVGLLVISGLCYWLAPQFSQSVISKTSLVFNDPISEFEHRIQNSKNLLESKITSRKDYRADSFSLSHNIVKIPLSETNLYTATVNVEYQYGTGGDFKYTHIIKFLYVKDIGWLVTGANENPGTVLIAILEIFSDQEISYDKIDKQISRQKEPHNRIVKAIAQEFKQMGVLSFDPDRYYKLKEWEVYQTLLPQARVAARKSYSFQYYSAWVDYLVLSNQITGAVAKDRIIEWIERKAEKEFQSVYYSLQLIEAN